MNDKEAMIKCFLEQTMPWNYVTEDQIVKVSLGGMDGKIIHIGLQTVKYSSVLETVDLLELVTWIWCNPRIS